MAHIKKEGATSEYWRNRAKRSYALAQTLGWDAAMQALMLHVVADYMQLADRAAKREMAETAGAVEQSAEEA
jgi:hypothetical protein